MGVAKAAGDAVALAEAVAKGWSSDASTAYALKRMAYGRDVVAYGRAIGRDPAVEGSALQISCSNV